MVVAIVIEVAFMIWMTTENRMELFVSPLCVSVKSIRNEYVPSLVESVVAIAMPDAVVGAHVIQVGHELVAVLITLYKGANGQPEGVQPKVGVVRVCVLSVFGFSMYVTVFEIVLLLTEILFVHLIDTFNVIVFYRPVFGSVTTTLTV